jgi:GNAT superfamily N-acetyltransferase
MCLVTIRPAKSGDESILSLLSSQLGYKVSDSEIAQRVAALARQPDRLILVSESDREVVGWIEVQLRDSLVSGRYAEIEGLVVDERRRGVGIGKALVERACAWAVERGAAKVRVRSNVTRERTQQFYEKLGFSLSKRQVVMDKSI